MNNYNNISEYQKIVFVNGLNEQVLNETQPIKELSQDYPFAVFLTTDSVVNDIDTGDIVDLGIGEGNITNMWLNGIRLTRFRGVDKNCNTIVIGDHTLKIKFNYVKGLIGVYDENILESIEITRVQQASINDAGIQWVDVNSASSFRIFSKNNQFKIQFKFKLKYDDNGLYENSNIESISKELIYDSNLFSKTYERSLGISNRNLEEDYEFTYSINKSTESYDGTNIEERTLTFISQYSRDAQDTAQFKIFRNPLSYYILIDGEHIEDGTTIYIDHREDPYDIDLVFTPSDITSKQYHRLIAEIDEQINSTNADVIEIDGNYQQEIINGQCHFKFKTIMNFGNEYDDSSSITIRIKYETDNSGRFEYIHLSKRINICLNQRPTHKYFYFGYSNPIEDTTLLTAVNYTDVEIGTTIWGDHDPYNIGDRDPRRSERQNYLEFQNKENESIGFFYCAIPLEYASDTENNKGIKPRWLGFTNEYNLTNESSLNGDPNYVDCVSWFNIYNKNLNGIDFVIYKRKQRGKFYGIIK